MSLLLLAPSASGFQANWVAVLDGGRKASTRLFPEPCKYACRCLWQKNVAFLCQLAPQGPWSFGLRSDMQALCRWGLRYKPNTFPRLIGWAPRGCPTRRPALERRNLAHGNGEEEGEGLQVTKRTVSWDSLGADERDNFTQAIWTCESPAQLFFIFDHEECHYIHEGSARVAIVQSFSSRLDEGAETVVEVKAGDYLVTPGGARVRWDILSPVKKQTSCREPFRMVSQGWILAPPLASYFRSRAGSSREQLKPDTLRRSMSASALIDTLQENLSHNAFLRKKLS